MRLVTFSQAVAPFGIGDTRLVPDDVAEDLSDKGLLSANDAWPPKDEKAPEKPVRPVIQPTRPAGRAGDQRIAR